MIGHSLECIGTRECRFQDVAVCRGMVWLGFCRGMIWLGFCRGKVWLGFCRAAAFGSNFILARPWAWWRTLHFPQTQQGLQTLEFRALRGRQGKLMLYWYLNKTQGILQSAPTPTVGSQNSCQPPRPQCQWGRSIHVSPQ